MAKHKILIVDDEPHIVRSLAFVLEREGYGISTAADGVEALAQVRASKPDVMLLDVMMPRKNGYEVCEEVKRDPDLKDVYIVILTAKGQEADRASALSVGADELITKPFSPAQIVARVKELIGQIAERRDHGAI